MNAPPKSAARAARHAQKMSDKPFSGKRKLALPKPAESWSLTSLREKLVKIGAKVISHGRNVTFQIAEIAVSRQMFADILSLIARLRAPPAPA